MADKPFHDVVVSKVEDTPGPGKLHLRVPTVMGLGFFGGVLVMVSHHTLYQLMDGHPANDPSLQVWVLRGGIALAFLSTTCLAIATRVAYDQRMWMDLRSRPQDIGTLDSLFGILKRPLEFLNLRVWLRSPLLAFVAAVAWLLPISAIFTASTLSVQHSLASTNDTQLYCDNASDCNTTAANSMATIFLNTNHRVVQSAVFLNINHKVVQSAVFFNINHKVVQSDVVLSGRENVNSSNVDTNDTLTGLPIENNSLVISNGTVSNDNNSVILMADDLREYFELQFVYEPRTLIVAYGLSGFLALVCVGLGVHALMYNRASYANSFSTIARVTRDSTFSGLIVDEGDLQGAEPLPKHMRNTEVWLARG